MLSLSLLRYLAIGTTVMMIPIMIQGSWYQLKVWKRCLLAVMLTLVGTLGTYLLFFIENQRFGGISFYGAIFVVPVVFLGMAKLFREPYKNLMDICAVAECAMLIIMKVQCLAVGCCSGRIFNITGGATVKFPSQFAEMLNGLVLLVVLLWLSRKEKCTGHIYPLYMLFYGITRFVLNFFRADQTIFALGLVAGSFWSIISIAIGVVWLVYIAKTSE